jgi:peptidoglycan/xylan/chitin deacetylase (PgdA/CDA1 family)
MIGIAVDPTEQDVVAEFFELFKTPWEFHRKDGRYDVLVCTRKQVPQNAATLILLYSAEAVESDVGAGFSVKSRRGGTMLVYDGRRIPIYGDVATFPGSRFAPVTEESTGEPATFTTSSGNRTTLRIGYDLFKEGRHVLNAGQPAANAGSATLDLHITLLRDLITKSGIPVVEIPPVPEGHNLIICLTHDIDHPVLRNHFCDHTMAGFLYRATIGTIIDVCRKRKSPGDLCINCAAVLKLPFVYLGMARDFWRGFDRYVEMEAGLASTYFVIPTRNYPGRPLAGNGDARRAARYDVTDVRPQLQKVISSGCEVGLHGIDTWVDSTKGREERDRVTQTLDTTVTGVRMHWLYFDGNSPKVIEQAGFSYDSSVGYNETVGYRAGTAQVYRPLGAANLLELPLHIMDTALFFPDFLNLSNGDAWRVVVRFIDDLGRFSGVLTINWHDRSIAPERLWAGFYLKLLRELKSRGAWFATAAQTVSWFRKRRSAVIEAKFVEDGKIRIKASVKSDSRLPGLRVRVHKPGTWKGAEETPAQSSPNFVDIALGEKIDTEIEL